jgi:methylase of polypeptide subunit release factors
LNGNDDPTLDEGYGFQCAAGSLVQKTALLQLARALKNQRYHFVTVTPATHARVNSRPGNEWAIDLHGIFGWSRPFQLSIVPTEILELMQAAKIITRYGSDWRSLLRVSTIKDRLFFHSAFPTAEADAVFLGPDTYRFVNAIENHLSNNKATLRRVVDVGCGAGPGAISVALCNPEAEILAVDINDGALLLASINAALAGVANVLPLYSNLLNDVQGQFDLIVANPPYLLDPSQRTYRHGGGLLGSGLSYGIVKAALERLTAGGTLVLYTGVAIVGGIDLFRLNVEKMLYRSNATWCYSEVDPDVFGEELLSEAYRDADRIAAILLTITNR